MSSTAILWKPLGTSLNLLWVIVNVLRIKRNVSPVENLIRTNVEAQPKFVCSLRKIKIPDKKQLLCEVCELDAHLFSDSKNW